MTEAGLAVFVLVGFLLPVPVLAWLDLALWPNSASHLGIGLWRMFPNGWWVFELAVIVTLWAYYWRRSTADPTFGAARLSSLPC